MKKILYSIMLVGLAFFASCEDQLETNPTDRVSGPVIFADATSAEAAINGIYRMLYTAGWSQNWSTENMGITAINLVSNLMGEDHIMLEVGQGWFFYDYAFDVRGDFVHKSGRSYGAWNFFYSIIANANYIIASENSMGGDPGLIKSVVGQAYAMRAFAYFHLIQIFQQTYLGNEDALGVPVYTEPTTSSSEGKPRGTVQEVYTQINLDINEAIDLLKDSGISQKHISHVDYYVANGFKARIDMVQHKYSEAAVAAAEALTKPGLKRVLTVSELGKFNNADLGNVLWGLEIIADQTSGWASFFSHMDADAKMYGSQARQCINSWLYNQIPATDGRKDWFRGLLAPEDRVAGTSKANYCQLKFAFADVVTRTGDYILMRAEELILIQAEALAHQSNFTDARTLILELGNKRDTDYANRLSLFTDSKDYNQNTTGTLSTLMDEILFQRRVELWGEGGRLWDLQRLKLGFNRNFSGTNHTRLLTAKNTTAGSKEFVLPLPQSEIDGNPFITVDDQNPNP